MTMLKNNLELLKKRYPEIYNEIKDIHVDSNAYQIIQNNEGQKTLKVTLDLYGELERLQDTAKSHHRVMVLEVMGRHAGWLVFLLP